VIECELEPDACVTAPDRLLVAARVDVEHVRDARRAELTMQLFVFVAETVIAPTDVEAEEGRTSRERASERETKACALACALRVPDPRSSACVPCGSVGRKYPLHDSITENEPRWCNATSTAP